jgi:hypothetical protein
VTQPTWRVTLVLTDNSQHPLCFGQALQEVEEAWRPTFELKPPGERSRARLVYFQRWSLDINLGNWRNFRSLDLMPPAASPVAASVKPVPPPSELPRPVKGARPHPPTSLAAPSKVPSVSTIPVPPNALSHQQEPARVPEVSDPLDEPDSTWHAENSPVDPRLVERHNRLLYWLSAAGEGAWEAFREACQILGLAAEPGHARRVQRCLLLLGHLTLSDNGMRWTVPAPTLRPTTVSGDLFLLCGQRSPSLLKDLPLHRTLMEQPGGQGPTRILVRSDEVSAKVTLGNVSYLLESPNPLAQADALPALQGWADNLRGIDRPNLASFAQVERWNDGSWQAGRLHETSGRYVGESGLYRLTRSDRCRFTVTVFFDSQRQRFLRGDWYGLRFLARQKADLPCRAVWTQQTLLIPLNERWPLLFEQTLAQSTGLLPDRVDKGKYLRYADVPESLARVLCQRLAIEPKVPGPLPASAAPASAGS